MRCICNRSLKWEQRRTWHGEKLERVYVCSKCLEEINDCRCAKLFGNYPEDVRQNLLGVK